MIFLGESTIFCADDFTVPLTCSNTQNIMMVELENSIYDQAFFSDDRESVKVPSTDDPQWFYDTLMLANFNGDTHAGNIDWNFETTDGILIKRKREDEYIWQPILYKSVQSIDDLKITGKDFLPGNGYYYYSIVPVNGYIEGEMSSSGINVIVDELSIIGIDDYYHTVVTDGFCNETVNTPSAIVETLRSKYPTVVSNSDACYKTIEVSASFYPNICDQDNGIFDDETRSRFISKLLDFLSDNKPKILKNIDGRRWLVRITNPPTNSGEEIYKYRNISFSCTEIGSIDDEEILTQCGFVNIPEPFWN